MPELPEVETVRCILKEVVLGKVIKNFKCYWPRMLRGETTLLTLNEKLTGQTIIDIKRLGKHLLFCLSNNILLSHLRMEGQYFFTKDTKQLDNSHVLAVFVFSDNSYLCYHDTRRFGTFFLRTYNNYLTSKPLNQLGVEPFDDKFTSAYLASKWKNSNKCIKTALLDQTVIAGIGNIYANEILFLSKISPFILVKNLKVFQLKTIVKNTILILNKAIAAGGTTISTFKTNQNITGKFQNYLMVHQKEGTSCNVCHSKIQRAKINQRSAYFCLKCQK